MKLAKSKRATSAVVALVLTMIASLFAGPTATAATANFGDYSKIFSRSAGQYWSGNQVGGQWAWAPQSSTESVISWGKPSAWPPVYGEHFQRSDGWLLLDGWADNGSYYKLRVSSEQVGDARCENLKPLASDGGRQHYVRWDVPNETYCLKAWGTITEQSTGKTVKFAHTQLWFPPASCGNQYFKNQACVKQWESWWDNRGAPNAEPTHKMDRDQYLARGIGMAFAIQQYYPSNWHADLRYAWNW